MCPSRLALHHPAAANLLQYATKGCPAHTGANWTVAQMKAMLKRGPHQLACTNKAVDYFQTETVEKSGKTMVIPLVNEKTTIMAPKGAIDQHGHCLQRIIYAFGMADPNAHIFNAKFDVKDGFWNLKTVEGEEWNFCHHYPKHGKGGTKLVVPLSLNMGWVDSPPYFCVSSETGQDVAADYAGRPVGSIPPHKFSAITETAPEFQLLPPTAPPGSKLRYVLEVYVNNYIALAMPVAQDQLRHVGQALMHRIHDVLPPNDDAAWDPILYKKLSKGEGIWMLEKEILGFMFNGEANHHTIWLSDKKRQLLITTITQWLQATWDVVRGIPFDEFRSTIYKIWHAFITMPAGPRLLALFDKVIAKEPPFVYLHRNALFCQTLQDAKEFLHHSISTPTKCLALIHGPPTVIGVKDASKMGVGGIIIEETAKLSPLVWRFQWTPDIMSLLISDANPDGTITNSDLKCARLLLLWLIMEWIMDALRVPIEGSHVALFSDNSPTVYWVRRSELQGNLVAIYLL
ncbi:hypothetical protein ACHAXS_005969 [Conticribra weissflogii]